MCNPALLAGAQLVAGAADVVQQRRTTQANAAFQQKRADLNSQLVGQQVAGQLTQLQKQQQQENQALAAQLQELRRRGNAAEATAAVGAAEAGTRGESINALNRDLERQTLQSARNLTLSQKFRDDQRAAQAEQIRLGQQVTLLNGQPDPFVLPNYLTAALRIGLDSYNTYQSAKPRTGEV